MVKNALSLFVITVIILVVFLPSYSKMQDLKTRNQELANKIRALEIKNKQLEQEGRFLKNNPEYLEKVAREKMGLIRQGETVYKIVPEEKKKR